MAIPIRPLHDRVVVRRIEESNTTLSGLIIPDTAKERPSQGEVLAVGAGKILDGGNVVPMDVQVGDRVLFAKHAGTEIKIEGDTFLMMKETDIFGVLTD